MFTLVFALALCGAVAAEDTSTGSDPGGTVADSSTGSIDSPTAVDSSCSDSDSGSSDTSTSEAADMSNTDSNTVDNTSDSDAGAESSTVGEVTQEDPTSDEIVQDVESEDGATEEENSKEIIETNSTTETVQEDVELEEDAIDTTGIVMQSTDFNCGPAALATVLNNMGINTTEQELATLAGTDESGTTMYGLAEAAKAKGLNAVGMKLSIEELKKNNIVYVTIDGGPHYSVLKEVTDTGVLLADPSLGNIEMSKEEFAGVYSGNVLVITDPNVQAQEVSNSTQVNGTTKQINNETNQISGNTSSEPVTDTTNLQPQNTETLTNDEMQSIKATQDVSSSTENNGTLELNVGTTEPVNKETSQSSEGIVSSEPVNNGIDANSINEQSENSKTLTDEEMQSIKGNGLVKVYDYYINRGKRNSVWVVVCKLNNPSIIFAGINLWGYYLTKAPGQPVKKYSFSNKYGIVSPVNPTWAFEFSRPYIIYG